MSVLIPPRLAPGDRVRVVSPASTPYREFVARGVEALTRWGLEVELGRHVFDSVGYLAGTDEDRLADLNDAFRDPGVRAVFATRGGKGAYRISDQLDFGAVRRDPKPLVGFSDITAVHLSLWKECGLVGVHGPFVNDESEGADGLRRVLMTTDDIVIKQDPKELSAGLTDGRRATGFLMGGNLNTVAHAVGGELSSLDGGILLIEDNLGTGLGMIDRQLTQLIKSGLLDGLRGIAVGQLNGFEDERVNGWSVLDVMRDRFDLLDVPVLGGLPIGHGRQPVTVPLGTVATIDPAAGTLTVAAGVR
ncbi:LD-carboxypeptidase [Kribbella sp. NPDC049174]|uniref:S66 peptidase family protein n=1 Tax=Kribbella sp. NPDC049174 TaxID=3364112 RepID=UPI0037245584